MADVILKDGGNWLPSEFLSDEDIHMDKENINKNGNNSNGFCFPSEFPYEFGSSSFLSSQADSVRGLTASESNREYFLTGLTRQFARATLQETPKIPSAQRNYTGKTWVLPGSPKSTLGAIFGNGNSNAPSPPTTPPDPGEADSSWNLRYPAVGQMRSRGPLFLTSVQPQGRQKAGSVWGRQEKGVCFPQEQVSLNGGAMVSGGHGRAMVLSQYDWHPPQVQPQIYQNQPRGGGGGMRAVFPGGSGGGSKSECAGTGVFLPRRYGNPWDSRKKPAGYSSALRPPRLRNFVNMTNQAPLPFDAGLVPDYDIYGACYS